VRSAGARDGRVIAPAVSAPTTVDAEPTRWVVVGAGAGPLACTVALNVAVAAASGGTPTLLHDLDGAAARALARVVGLDGVVALPWTTAPLQLRTAGGETSPPAPHTLVIVAAPRRLDAPVRAELERAAVVLVPMDATAVARRALREVAALLAASPAPALLHAVLGRSLPRDADRWALLEEIEALAPGALLSATLPAGRAGPGPAGADAARLYAPGTAAATAYAAVLAAVVRSLETARAGRDRARLTSTSP
jgi:hypothetical protein